MKLILSEADRSNGGDLQKNLRNWGFEVIEKRTESSIIAAVKSMPDIRIVIIGSGDINVKRFCARIREQRHYVYLILLVDEAESWSIDPKSVEPDFIISKPLDVNRLRIELYGVRKSIELTMKFLQLNRTQPIEFQRQIINLDLIESNFGSDRQSAFQHLSEMIRIAKSAEFGIQEQDWLDVLTESEKLGCEQLSDWISGMLFLKLNDGIATSFSPGLIRFQLTQIVKNLDLGLKSLKEFGYFDDKPDGLPKNPLEGKRILLVEDMQYNRTLLKKILQKQNCIIFEATDGQNAVESWQQLDHVDVVIMDMNMPVMDGFSATKKIREIEKQKSLKRTPIIALTALAMRGDKELCMEAGTDDYLPKPVEAKSLIKVCRKLLSPEEAHSAKYSDYIPELGIKNVLLKSKDQISIFSLRALFMKLGIELEIENETKSVLNRVVEEAFDLIVLDSEYDLELAFFIKSNFKNQNIALIASRKGVEEFLPKMKPHHFIFPFRFDQFFNVLQYFSDKRKQALKDAEQKADVDSLGKINRQANIEEAVQKSNHQLAVWQKAFRKIGGDLVLSHQFNLHGKFGLILGDVAGHDIQSGYTASWFSGLVEGIWGDCSNPYKFLVNLNNRFAHDTKEENKRFVCALVLLWDPLRGKLYYANAGIPGGILIKKDTGKSESMDWKGVPIGMFPDMDMYDHGVIDFIDGDRLIMATDGVLEAIPRGIISDLSESSIDKTAQQTLDVIVDFVTRSIEIIDDLTIAVFEAKVPETPKIGYRQTIRSDFKEVDLAVARMGEFIQKQVPERYDWPMISVAIREALINAVEHGNKNDVNLPVDIDFELGNGEIAVTVSDCGSGFDLSTEKKRLAKEGDLRIHGRGIEMMENIGKSVTFLGGGTRIVFGETGNQ